MITDDDARENKATTSCYPSLATAGQKPPPSSARKNTIELGFNFFNSKEQNGNDMSEGVKKSNKSRSARPFNRVNDEE